MNQAEYCEQRDRIMRFEALRNTLDRLHRAIVDVKVPDGVLRIDIGGGAGTFQTLSGPEIAFARESLLKAFRARAEMLAAALEKV